LYVRLLFDDKGTDIGICSGHGHGAENTVALAPCDDPDVIADILLELGAPVLVDDSAG
jgi:hypothetical protein